MCVMVTRSFVRDDGLVFYLTEMNSFYGLCQVFFSLMLSVGKIYVHSDWGLGQILTNCIGLAKKSVWFFP